MLPIKRIVLLSFVLLAILTERCVCCDCGCGDDSVIQYTEPIPEQPQLSPFRSAFEGDDSVNPFGPGAFVVRPKPLPKPVPRHNPPPCRSNVYQTAPICNPIYQRAPQMQEQLQPCQMRRQIDRQMQKRQQQQLQQQQQQRLMSNPIIEPLESVRFDDDYDTCPSYDPAKMRLRRKLNRFNCVRPRRYF